TLSTVSESSGEEPPAVDEQVLPGDELGALADEVEQRAHEILRQLIALQAALGGDDPGHLGLPPCVSGVVRAVVRADRVDGEVPLAELARQRPRHPDAPRLRRNV